ncbi:MAG: bacteriocin, partial [Lachnospiraceae bacterium]|nr:bacteriocin [Lachnospiraceae bacterium]
MSAKKILDEKELNEVNGGVVSETGISGDKPVTKVCPNCFQKSRVTMDTVICPYCGKDINHKVIS